MTESKAAQSTGDLVRAALTGDRVAFEMLVRQYAAMVMASIPSATCAAGATTTATAVKSSSVTGAAASSAVGGAILGSLLGIAGGLFGTWMSWRNCYYENQQRFILRQALRYAKCCSSRFEAGSQLNWLPTPIFA